MIALGPSGLVDGAEPRVGCTAANTDVDEFLLWVSFGIARNVLVDAPCHCVNWNCHDLVLEKKKAWIFCEGQLREMSGYTMMQGKT